MKSFSLLVDFTSTRKPTTAELQDAMRVLQSNGCELTAAYIARTDPQVPADVQRIQDPEAVRS